MRVVGSRPHSPPPPPLRRKPRRRAPLRAQPAAGRSAWTAETSVKAAGRSASTGGGASRGAGGEEDRPRRRIRGPNTFVAPPSPLPPLTTTTTTTKATAEDAGGRGSPRPTPSPPQQVYNVVFHVGQPYPHPPSHHSPVGTIYAAPFAGPFAVLSKPIPTHFPESPPALSTTPPPTPVTAAAPAATPRSAAVAPPPRRKPRRRAPCAHNRRRSQCVDCYNLGQGGGSICIHRRRRVACEPCRASGEDDGPRRRIRGPNTFVAPPPPPPPQAAEQARRARKSPEAQPYDRVAHRPANPFGIEALCDLKTHVGC
ncbi:hypothetical protein DFJ73DRAFT_914069 [Zopfochytrium polystomum]|nr:hypothetical protein DFJ73DRAFT_914069 [Zopfochytrium polystomum]